MPRSHLLFLDGMQLSMERIGRYCMGLSFAEFCASELVVDGVVRNMAIIGEAAKKVPVELQQKYPQLPWSQMYRMRNRIPHEYFGLDYATIWRVATEHLPLNYQELLLVITSERKRLGK